MHSCGILKQTFECRGIDLQMLTKLIFAWTILVCFTAYGYTWEVNVSPILHQI